MVKMVLVGTGAHFSEGWKRVADARFPAGAWSSEATFGETVVHLSQVYSLLAEARMMSSTLLVVLLALESPFD